MSNRLPVWSNLTKFKSFHSKIILNSIKDRQIILLLLPLAVINNQDTAADGIEALGCRIFYCDPMASSQKAHVENNHLLFLRSALSRQIWESLVWAARKKRTLFFSYQFLSQRRKTWKKPDRNFRVLPCGFWPLKWLDLKKLTWISCNLNQVCYEDWSARINKCSQFKKIWHRSGDNHEWTLVMQICVSSPFLLFPGTRNLVLRRPYYGLIHTDG